MSMQPTTKISLTFIFQHQPLFQLTLSTPSFSISIKELLSHVIKAISMDMKDSPQPFFMINKEQSIYAYKDEKMQQQKIHLHSLVSQLSDRKLFYNLHQEQYDMLRNEQVDRKNKVVKQMKSDHMNRKFMGKQKLNEEDGPVNQQQKQAMQHGQHQIINTKEQKQSLSQTLPIQQTIPPVQKPQVSIKVKVQPSYNNLPNQSSPIHTQSIYFQHQPNLNTNNNKQIHPFQVDHSQHPTQKQIQPTQLRSQNTQQVKDQSCCQII